MMQRQRVLPVDNATVLSSASRFLLRLERRSLHYMNWAIRPMNLRVDHPRPTGWDEFFRDWIAEAKRNGGDPNEIGDSAWDSDLLQEGLKEYYLPLAGPAARIVEFGPGSGRLSRHLVGKCKELIVADVSPTVCKWLAEYLKGRGAFSVVQIEGPSLPAVPAGTVDAVVAHGFFEHLDQEDVYLFLVEASRVLRPAGVVAFNFDDLTSPAARELVEQGARSRRSERFRLHHPEALRSIAELAGLQGVQIAKSDSRISFARMVKA